MTIKRAHKPTHSGLSTEEAKTLPLAEQRKAFELFANGLLRHFPAGGDPRFLKKIEAWRKAAHEIIDLTADGAIERRAEAQKLFPPVQE